MYSLMKKLHKKKNSKGFFFFKAEMFISYIACLQAIKIIVWRECSHLYYRERKTGAQKVY